MIQQAALANPLSLMLDKDRRDFTRADMLRVIRERGVERLSFHYTSVDGKLRELKLRFGPEPALRKRELLRRLEGARLEDADAVLTLHDLLCFWRAYPDDARVLERIERGETIEPWGAGALESSSSSRRRRMVSSAASDSAKISILSSVSVPSSSGCDSEA